MSTNQSSPPPGNGPSPPQLLTPTPSDALLGSGHGPGVWPLRDRLALASTLIDADNQHVGWQLIGRRLASISRRLTDAHRPPSWCSARACAKQYSLLLDSIELSSATTTATTSGSEQQSLSVTERIVKRLSAERVDELRGRLLDGQRYYSELKEHLAALESGAYDDHLSEIQTLQASLLDSPNSTSPTTTSNNVNHSEDSGDHQPRSTLFDQFTLLMKQAALTYANRPNPSTWSLPPTRNRLGHGDTAVTTLVNCASLGVRRVRENTLTTPPVGGGPRRGGQTAKKRSLLHRSGGNSATSATSGQAKRRPGRPPAHRSHATSSSLLPSKRPPRSPSSSSSISTLPMTDSGSDHDNDSDNDQQTTNAEPTAATDLASIFDDENSTEGHVVATSTTNSSTRQQDRTTDSEPTTEASSSCNTSSTTIAQTEEGADDQTSLSTEIGPARSGGDTSTSTESTSGRRGIDIWQPPPIPDHMNDDDVSVVRSSPRRRQESPGSPSTRLVESPTTSSPTPASSSTSINTTNEQSSPAKRLRIRLTRQGSQLVVVPITPSPPPSQSLSIDPTLGDTWSIEWARRLVFGAIDVIASDKALTKPVCSRRTRNRLSLRKCCSLEENRQLANLLLQPLVDRLDDHSLTPLTFVHTFMSLLAETAVREPRNSSRWRLAHAIHRLVASHLTNALDLHNRLVQEVED